MTLVYDQGNAKNSVLDLELIGFVLDCFVVHMPSGNGFLGGLDVLEAYRSGFSFKPATHRDILTLIVSSQGMRKEPKRLRPQGG